MSEIDYHALRENAESTIGILENIAGFEPSDIDGDTVELRFETDGGFDTGCDVSIVDQCQKTADVVRALLDELERNQQYIKSRDQENEDIALTVGKLRVNLEASEKRIAELESLTAPQLPQPAPVSAPEVVGWEDVPEEITEDDIALASAWAIGFNQCRAAMLKSFGNSEQLDEVGSWNNHLNTPTAQAGNHTEQRLAMVNSTVIPDGWVLAPKEITCAMDDAAWEAYHETRCMSDIWAALIAAAPQQEVK